MCETNPQEFYSSSRRQPSGSHYGHRDELRLRRKESERLERMAGRMIEQAMTAVVVRVCWQCERRFVKTAGCHEVVCVCGARTCHKCGGRMEVDERHRCGTWLPEPSWRAIREAARAAKHYLRYRYPGLQFKYDPSRRMLRSRRYRRGRNRVMTE